MKKIYLLLLSLTLIFTFVACGNNSETNQDANLITVPDVVDISLSDAKNVVSNMGLIPHIEYKYHDTIPEDNVIKCDPAVGETISKGQSVTLIISKGPQMIHSNDSYANWTYITYGVEDEWEFHHPYIKDNTLYIECHTVTFGTAMTWRDRYNEGCASGTASINDTFDKVVPVRVEYEKQRVSANESQSFTIKVPLENLDVTKPSNMYFRIGISANGQDTDLIFDFSMTW